MKICLIFEKHAGDILNGFCVVHKTYFMEWNLFCGLNKLHKFYIQLPQIHWVFKINNFIHLICIYSIAASVQHWEHHLYHGSKDLKTHLCITLADLSRMWHRGEGREITGCKRYKATGNHYRRWWCEYLMRRDLTCSGWMSRNNCAY